MMLDVDESVLNKKLQFISDLPPEVQSRVPWLQNDMKKHYSGPSKRIDPIPGACVKTWTKNGDKIFVNVCHSKDIAPPKDISQEELNEVLLQENPNFIIPMAIGFQKIARIKDGTDRPTFDILINTSYFQKCMKYTIFWAFTIQVTLESLNVKYNQNINVQKYVVLKNCKVMGCLDTFNIEDRAVRKPTIKKPLIEELDYKETEELPCNTKINAQNMKQQNYIIFQSDNGKNLIGFFYLPLSNITDITVDIGQNRIIVENKKTNNMTDIFVDYLIDNGNTFASYDNKLHILKLIMPLKNNRLS